MILSRQLFKFLKCILPVAEDGGEELDAKELDEAANENTYAAAQYKAIKLQNELENRPQMVSLV